MFATGTAQGVDSQLLRRSHAVLQGRKLLCARRCAIFSLHGKPFQLFAPLLVAGTLVHPRQMSAWLINSCFEQMSAPAETEESSSSSYDTEESSSSSSDTEESSSSSSDTEESSSSSSDTDSTTTAIDSTSTAGFKIEPGHGLSSDEEKKSHEKSKARHATGQGAEHDHLGSTIERLIKEHKTRSTETLAKGPLHIGPSSSNLSAEGHRHHKHSHQAKRPASTHVHSDTHPSSNHWRAPRLSDLEARDFHTDHQSRGHQGSGAGSVHSDHDSHSDHQSSRGKHNDSARSSHWSTFEGSDAGSFHDDRDSHFGHPDHQSSEGKHDSPPRSDRWSAFEGSDAGSFHDDTDKDGRTEHGRKAAHKRTKPHGKAKISKEEAEEARAAAEEGYRTIGKHIQEAVEHRQRQQAKQKEKVADYAKKLIEAVVKRSQLVNLPRARDKLAFIGTLAPLLLCNVPWATRDALLLLNTARACLFVSDGRNILTESARRNLAFFCTKLGITSELVHRVASRHAVLSPRTGEWAVPNKEYEDWIAMTRFKEGGIARFTEPLSASVGHAIRAGSNVHAAVQYLALSLPFMKPRLPAQAPAQAAMASAFFGILLAMWRQTEHAPRPTAGLVSLVMRHVTDYTTEPKEIHDLREAWQSLRTRREVLPLATRSTDILSEDGLQQLKEAGLEQRLDIAEIVSVQRATEMRAISAALLSWFSLADFRLTPTIALLVGRLCHTSHSDEHDVKFFAGVLVVILELGITPAFLQTLYQLPKIRGPELWSGGEAMKNTFQSATKALRGLKCGERAKQALLSLRSLPALSKTKLKHTQPQSMERVEFAHAVELAPRFSRERAIRSMKNPASFMGPLEKHRGELLKAAENGNLAKVLGQILAAEVHVEDGNLAFRKTLEKKDKNVNKALETIFGAPLKEATRHSHHYHNETEWLKAQWRSARYDRPGSPDPATATRDAHLEMLEEIKNERMETQAQTFYDLKVLLSLLPVGEPARLEVSTLPSASTIDADLLPMTATVDHALRFIRAYPSLLRGEPVQAGISHAVRGMISRGRFKRHGPRQKTKRTYGGTATRGASSSAPLRAPAPMASQARPQPAPSRRAGRAL